MYREHLRNSNTAAIYDDIYENIGGGDISTSVPPAQLSRGTVPSCPPPVSLRPWSQCFPKFGGSLLSMTKCLKYNRIVAGHIVAAARLQLYREVICCLLPLRASAAGLCGRYGGGRSLTVVMPSPTMRIKRRCCLSVCLSVCRVHRA